MPDVKMPDGTIIRNVPEGTTRSALQARYEARNNASKPTSFWSGVGDEIRHVAHNVDAAVTNINPFDRLMHAVAPNTRFDPDYTRPRINANEQRRVNARPDQGSTAGKIAGGVLATIPAMFVPGGPLAEGAVMGAMQTDSHTAGGALRDAVMGAGFGKAGQVVGRAASRVIGGSPASKAVRLLHNEGITLTPGQRAGPKSVKQFVEDKVLGSLPGFNAIPDSAAARGANDLRVAVANRVLKPIGGKLPAKTPINSSAMGGINQKVYNAYDTAAGRLSLAHDADSVLGIDKIVRDAPAKMLPDEAILVANKAKSIGTVLTHGPVTGDTLRAMLGDIRETASGAKGPLGKSLWKMHDEFSDALQRQNPANLTADFIKARESVSLLKRMENAASRAGVVDAGFGPTHLKMAAEKRGFGTNDANVADKTAPLMDIASAAAEVMRNKTANSGTIPRGMAMKAIGTVGASGGAAGALTGINPLAAGFVGSQLLGYIPGVAEILQKAALNRAPGFQKAGKAVEKVASPLGAAIAAALGINQLSGR